MQGHEFSEITSEKVQLPPRQPKTTVWFAFADKLPKATPVQIEKPLIPEKILDKRMNEELDHYQYLVKMENLSKLHAVWMGPKEVHPQELVKEFEDHRATETSLKQTVAYWYPFGENFTVWWKDTPYFIVSYGGGQFNKFCIVGLDKEKKVLKCKNTSNCHTPRHQSHAKMVKKLMVQSGLVVYNKTIVLQSMVAGLPSFVPDCSSSNNSIPKPLSNSKISLFLPESIRECLVKQVQFYIKSII